MIKIQILVDDKLNQLITKSAKDQGLSLSATVRSALIKYFNSAAFGSAAYTHNWKTHNWEVIKNDKT